MKKRSPNQTSSFDKKNCPKGRHSNSSEIYRKKMINLLRGTDRQISQIWPPTAGPHLSIGEVQAKTNTCYTADNSLISAMSFLLVQAISGLIVGEPH
jgi:hypothetical protein